MKILIVSGFLGAGKTTFIRNLRLHTGKEFVVYENEYADTGVDTKLLETDEISVWESTEKCVCCSGKQDFASSILTISNTIDPEYLVVEPTGIAKLGNILDNIRQVEYERIEILAPITLADATNYFAQKAKYREILENQIEYGSEVIITKDDLADTAECSKIKDYVEKITTGNIKIGYKDLDDKWWQGLLLKYSDGREIDPASLSHSKHPES
ncbi:MAG: GTP-binding protein, partial [Armatimonadetes bacterium]|nr:GTP-binding protein [Candidatus Hippobium faecium]